MMIILKSFYKLEKTLLTNKKDLFSSGLISEIGEAISNNLELEESSWAFRSVALSLVTMSYIPFHNLIKLAYVCCSICWDPLE